MLTDQSRFDEAAAAATYERAIHAGDAEVAPRAMLGLADLLCDDEPERAARLYRRTADSGHTEVAPAAERML